MADWGSLNSALLRPIPHFASSHPDGAGGSHGILFHTLSIRRRIESDGPEFQNPRCRDVGIELAAGSRASASRFAVGGGAGCAFERVPVRIPELASRPHPPRLSPRCPGGVDWMAAFVRPILRGARAGRQQSLYIGETEMRTPMRYRDSRPLFIGGEGYFDRRASVKTATNSIGLA